MMVPYCCGRRATPYKKLFFIDRLFGLTWESGFRCRRCGRTRLPAVTDAGWFITHRKPETQAQLDAIREEGMRFDASLNTPLDELYRDWRTKAVARLEETFGNSVTQ